MLNLLLGDDRPVAVDSFKCLAAAIFMGVIGPEVFIVQPGFVQGLVQYLGFSESQAGYIASAEMFGIAATTIVMTFAAHHFNWRHVFAVSLLIMIGANIASTGIGTLETLMGVRFIAGLGAGGLVSLSFAAIGLTSRPDRNFGLLIMWVLIYGALGLLAMPSVYAAVGMDGVLWFFALLPALGLPFIKHLPQGGETVAQVEADAVDLPANLRVTALLAMFCYFLAQGVVWAYLFLIGLDAGLGEQQVANGLTISQFTGVAGAFTAATVGGRLGRLLPLSAGILVGAATLIFLVGRYEFLVYLVAVGIYNYMWNLTHPYLLAAMASFDRHGRMVVYAVAMQMMGLALGPSLAALAIGDGNFRNVNYLGIALFVLSWLLILPSVLSQARLTRRR